jgi:3-hydroxybutyryl-CoA dehydrogenase
MVVGVIGAGTMGAGIAQVALQNGHRVVLLDVNSETLNKAKESHINVFNRLIQKGSYSEVEVSNMLEKIIYSSNYSDLSSVGLVIEAVVERLDVKHQVFAQVEQLVSDECILASNTSSLSIASIGSVLTKPERIIGLHFFNPAPLMPLVEVIPAVQTSNHVLNTMDALMKQWGKASVICKDTPGFIVNRVARPFYGEALRIYEEGIADFATIDWAMTSIGGFKMGPFTLMDYIGNDVNYAVTESVFAAFYYDPRFKPSFTQKRHMEAGYLGRKTKRGYYDYSKDDFMPQPVTDSQLGNYIFERILVMLINEAFDAVFMQVASPEDIDLAMTKGVNYPKGLLAWAENLGFSHVLHQLEKLFEEYGEDRYRPNPLLKKMVRDGLSFS